MKEKTMRLYASNGTTSRSARRSARLNRPQDGVAVGGRYTTKARRPDRVGGIRTALAAVVQALRAYL